MKANRVFWRSVDVGPAGEGFTVALDGRPIKTPLKSEFVVPSRSLAARLAEEWQVQSDEIRPETMPFTRLSNSAIDKIPAQFGETVDALAAYAETDMTCFRAEGPERLVARQAELWDPPLAWMQDTHGVALIQTVGVVPVAQPANALGAVRDWLAAQSPFRLMALHELIGLSGSVVIARAVAEGGLDPDRAWEASVLEEMWNIELWGEDAEARAYREAKRAAFATAYEFLSLLTDVT